jgi:dienelactone hydrolase
MDHDPIFVGDGDLQNARGLVSQVAGADLFLYPGNRHLFTDSSLSSYDEQATKILLQRIMSLLGRLHQLPE